MSKRQKGLVAFAVVVVLLGVGAGIWFWQRPAPVHPTEAAPAPEGKHLDDLVPVVLDRNRSPDEREAAIASLRDAKAVNHLIQLLPPAGDYGGTTATVIEALGEVGDPRALPALRRVQQRPPQFLVSGEFWALLKVVIAKLEKQLT
jgi:hypothetical protein